jgi:hypothetical protein
MCLPDGTPYVGKLLFIGPDLVTIDAQDVVLGGTNVVDLVDGAFSVTLAANDVAGMTPSGWTYRVIGVFDNAPGWIRNISLPKATPAVNLADVLVPDPVAGTYAVLVDQATIDRLAPLLEPVFTGDVTIVDGQFVVDSSGTAINAIDRGSIAAYVAYVLRTAGVDRWALQMIPGSNDLLLTDSANGVEVMRFVPSPTNPTVRVNADLVLDGTGKAYRFRRSGSNLDLEGCGVDLILSVWSGDDFAGTQHSYDRYSADAANVQHAGKREFVTALYGAVVHTIDPDAGTASFGGKNGLSPIRLAGFKPTAGAPTTGAWTVGDVVLDSAGAWHLCTTGGTPGTWT